MTKQVLTTFAFCLHSRPYRESSMIVHLFAEKAGKVSVIAKGIKRSSRKTATTPALLQPFTPLSVSITGSAELKTLVAVEQAGTGVALEGASLFAGLYVNELLMRLLADNLEYHDVYQHYQDALGKLQTDSQLEPALRYFERRLLECLGYEIPFVEVDEAGNPVGLLQSAEPYRFVPDSGFIRLVASRALANPGPVFSGEQLLKIASGNMHDKDVSPASKQLMRMALAPLLGAKPLNSKNLFT